MGVHVLGLIDRVTIQNADAYDENDTIRKQNPLGKMPCLIRADGSSIFDSSVILEFLPVCRRFGAIAAGARFNAIFDADANAAGRWHHRGRGTGHLRKSLSRTHTDIRTLAGLSARQDTACPCRLRGGASRTRSNRCCHDYIVVRQLGFLDKRKPVNWRPLSPRLVAWFAAFAKSEPAFERTAAPLP